MVAMVLVVSDQEVPLYSSVSLVTPPPPAWTAAFTLPHAPCPYLAAPKAPPADQTEPFHSSVQATFAGVPPAAIKAASEVPSPPTNLLPVILSLSSDQEIPLKSSVLVSIPGEYPLIANAEFWVPAPNCIPALVVPAPAPLCAAKVKSFNSVQLIPLKSSVNDVSDDGFLPPDINTAFWAPKTDAWSFLATTVSGPSVQTGGTATVEPVS